MKNRGPDEISGSDQLRILVKDRNERDRPFDVACAERSPSAQG